MKGILELALQYTSPLTWVMFRAQVWWTLKLKLREKRFRSDVCQLS
jgi:hypothetical protein